MIVEVSPKDLGALMAALANAPSYAVTLWRGMMEIHGVRPCRRCLYDSLLGRRCCCLCLESNLLHAWFASPSGKPVKDAHDTVKAHREGACGACAEGSCAAGS